VGDLEKQEKSPETKDIPGLPPTEKSQLMGDAASVESALKEAKQLSSGRSAEELKNDAAEREHNRNEGFRDLFDRLVRTGMYLAFAAIILMGLAWVWHLIMPYKWQWLTEPQIDHIQTLVTGGVLAVVVGDHFKRRLG
jgi:hypothetical protein